MPRREPAKTNPDILNDAVGSASQRGYALLTGLGATGTSTGDAAEMVALVKGAFAGSSPAGHG